MIAVGKQSVRVEMRRSRRVIF